MFMTQVASGAEAIRVKVGGLILIRENNLSKRSDGG